jgi:hypothetical protein
MIDSHVFEVMDCMHSKRIVLLPAALSIWVPSVIEQPPPPHTHTCLACMSTTVTQEHDTVCHALELEMRGQHACLTVKLHTVCLCSFHNVNQPRQSPPPSTTSKTPQNLDDQNPTVYTRLLLLVQGIQNILLMTHLYTGSRQNFTPPPHYPASSTLKASPTSTTFIDYNIAVVIGCMHSQHILLQTGTVSV